MPYKVRFVHPQRHFKLYGNEFMATLKDCLANGRFILSEDVSEFEQRLAKLCGTKYALGVNSGFDAIFLSLEAAGIGEGDEVITVAHTFLATIAPIVKLKAKPVLIDVGKDWNMDISLVKHAITERTKAIIPVHLNGRVCDMEALMSIAERHNLLVIEDACQSLSATLNGKKAGSFGLSGCFSFYPFKILGAFGEAGAVVTNNKQLYDKILLARYHGVDRTPQRRIHDYGWNAVLDNVQGAILNVKLNHFPKWIKRRQEIARIYYKELSSLQKLTLPHFPDKRFTDVYQNYVIQSAKRDKLRQFLEQQGIETLISWPTPLYRYKELGLTTKPLPVNEKICKEVLSLPMYPELSDREVGYVAKIIKQFFA